MIKKILSVILLLLLNLSFSWLVYWWDLKDDMEDAETNYNTKSLAAESAEERYNDYVRLWYLQDLEDDSNISNDQITEQEALENKLSLAPWWYTEVWEENAGATADLLNDAEDAARTEYLTAKNEYYLSDEYLNRNQKSDARPVNNTNWVSSSSSSTSWWPIRAVWNKDIFDSLIAVTSDNNITSAIDDDSWFILFENFLYWSKTSLTGLLKIVVIAAFLYLWARLTFARGKPEEFKKSLMHFVYAIIWIFIVTIAWALVTLVATINF